MVNVGQVAMKIAGRDAGQLCVVVDVIDSKQVLIDGAVRRRKCNIKHLELLGKDVKIKKGASGDEVRKALAQLGFNIREVKDTKKKEKKANKDPFCDGKIAAGHQVIVPHVANTVRVRRMVLVDFHIYFP